MLKRTYCLFDHKALTYMNPLVFLNDGEAIRWFTTVVNSQEQTNVSLYPKDFTLCYLGTFDDTSGKYTNEGEELITGNALKYSETKFTVSELYTKLREHFEDKH